MSELKFSRMTRAIVSSCGVVIMLCSATGCANSPHTMRRETDLASRDFVIRYEAEVQGVPPSARTAYLWVPLPPTTSNQTIHELKVDASLAYEEVTEPRYGNRALRFTLSPGNGPQKIALEVEVTRHERIHPPTAKQPRDQSIPAMDPAIWLRPDRRVPIDGRIRELADETVAGKKDPLDKARAIYDYVVDELDYDKSGTGWGNGDIYWACDAKRGNCTDFHALFIGLNRAIGVPARFEMGFPIPSDRSTGAIGGYHCWAQFHLSEAGWVPVDASEANKHPDMRQYFFGAHDENRVLFTVGRDLEFDGMRDEPLNFFIYPYAEVDGKKWDQIEKRFSYRNIGMDRS